MAGQRLADEAQHFLSKLQGQPFRHQGIADDVRKEDRGKPVCFTIHSVLNIAQNPYGCKPVCFTIHSVLNIAQNPYGLDHQLEC
ncbi:hypothetical protein SBV1_1860034 [Verrucomicrobia bacterium]|nr:hypothetical protein SBV1_1860034 [Verrucomicrobiota bacterium]